MCAFIRRMAIHNVNFVFISTLAIPLNIKNDFVMSSSRSQLAKAKTARDLKNARTQQGCPKETHT